MQIAKYISRVQVIAEASRVREREPRLQDEDVQWVPLQDVKSNEIQRDTSGLAVLQMTILCLTQ